MNEPSRKVTATAPGGIGNIGPGLDVLGCAVSGARDEITVEWRDEPGIDVADSGHPDLPRDAKRHTAALAAAAVLARAGESKRGLTLWCRKGLPLSGGQGGSAASAVAGAVATNALLGNPLGTDALLAACLDAESTVAVAISTTSRRRCSAGSCSSERSTRSKLSSFLSRQAWFWCSPIPRSVS